MSQKILKISFSFVFVFTFTLFAPAGYAIPFSEVKQPFKDSKEAQNEQNTQSTPPSIFSIRKQTPSKHLSNILKITQGLQMQALQDYGIAPRKRKFSTYDAQTNSLKYHD